MKHWADGGETKLDNLVTLCDFHHRLVHEGGHGVAVAADKKFVFTRPDGTQIPENSPPCFRGNILPPRPADSGNFEEALRIYMLNREAGLRIDPETSRSRWFGEAMDYSLAIESMQFLDRKVVAPPFAAATG